LHPVACYDAATWLQTAVPQAQDKIGRQMRPTDVIGYIKVNEVYDEETPNYFNEEIVRRNTPLELEWRE